MMAEWGCSSLAPLVSKGQVVCELEVGQVWEVGPDLDEPVL